METSYYEQYAKYQVALTPRIIQNLNRSFETTNNKTVVNNAFKCKPALASLDRSALSPQNIANKSNYFSNKKNTQPAFTFSPGPSDTGLSSSSRWQSNPRSQRDNLIKQMRRRNIDSNSIVLPNKLKKVPYHNNAQEIIYQKLVEGKNT